MQLHLHYPKHSLTDSWMIYRRTVTIIISPVARCARRISAGQAVVVVFCVRMFVFCLVLFQLQNRKTYIWRTILGDGPAGPHKPRSSMMYGFTFTFTTAMCACIMHYIITYIFVYIAHITSHQHECVLWTSARAVVHSLSTCRRTNNRCIIIRLWWDSTSKSLGI